MLQVRQLEKIIDNRSALSIERLDLNPGDIMTVIGLVGSGKTLLIRLLSGILSPGGGKVFLEGYNTGTQIARHENSSSIPCGLTIT